MSLQEPDVRLHTLNRAGDIVFSPQIQVTSCTRLDKNQIINSIIDEHRKSRMKQIRPYAITAVAILLLAVLMVIPVSGADATNVTYQVSATTSSATVNVGDLLMVSGAATGSNLSSGVQIWVFAGNYVNITTVPVNTKGEFAKTFPTAGLPPATYYIFVQSPGSDGKFDIDTPKVSGYTGQVVNTKTGAVIFNFTGTGSVKDAAAAQQLSQALNQQGIDDIYTKLTVQIVSPTTSATPLVTSAPPPVSQAPTTAKSPVSVLVALSGIGIACLAVFAMKRR